MILIPALLLITRPRVHSIDKKGRATLEIQLLTFPKTKKALTISKSYRKYTQDQIILVHNNPIQHNIHTLERVIGPVNELKVWDRILPYRINIPPSLKTYTPFIPNKPCCGLKPTTEFRHNCASTQYFCIDSPGTIDREDGFWYLSNRHMGIFVVDIPSQLNWNYNKKSCIEYLCDMWKTQHEKVKLTRTMYLPTHKLPLIHSDSYKCVEATNTKLPILCIDIIQNKFFPSFIEKHHTVHLATTNDPPSTYPEWFKKCVMKDWSVNFQNEQFNSKWMTFLHECKNKSVKVFSKSHPKYKHYCPITSPVRSIGDLWNQCIIWDVILKHKWKTIHNETLKEILKSILTDNHKSNYLKHHVNSIRLVQSIMLSEKTKLVGTLTYKHFDEENEIIYGILTIDNNYNIWVDSNIIIGSKEGDMIAIQCTLTKNPDPFRMIQVELDRPAIESSIEDTKKES